MPTYKITDPASGKTLKLTGDSPPTEAELTQIFGSVSQKESPAPPKETEVPETKKEGKSVGGFLGNALNDAGDIASGVYNMVRHPIDTATGLGKLAVGGSAAIQKKLGLLDRDVPIEGESSARKLAAPFVEAYRNPGGIPGQLAEYGYNKPVSAAFTLSGGLGTAGAAARAGSASRIANAMSAGSQVANPINMAGKIGTSGASALSKLGLPEKLYGSALKLPISEKWIKVAGDNEISRRKGAIKAGIENEVMPTEYGLAKATKLEKETRGVIDSLINENSSKIEGVTTADIVRNGLKDAYNKASRSSDPVGMKAFIDEMSDKFLEHGEKIPVNKLQEIKRQLYNEVKYASEESKSLPGQLASVGKKGLAHEAMIALEQRFPDLKLLNKKDASLIALKEGIQRAAARIENQDMVGLGAKVLLPQRWIAAAIEATTHCFIFVI